MCADEWDAKHTLRELRLMRLLEHHPNVISLRDLSVRVEEDCLYIAMELMDSDLHKIIQSKQKLSMAHCQVLMKQVLLGVNAMHKNDVFHRDLKPGPPPPRRQPQYPSSLPRAYPPCTRRQELSERRPSGRRRQRTRTGPVLCDAGRSISRGGVLFFDVFFRSL